MGDVSDSGDQVRIARDSNAFIVEIDGDIESLLGWAADELIGRPSTEFIHPQDQTTAVSTWLSMIAQPGRQLVWRGRYRSRSDEWIWIESLNSNHLDDPDHGCVVSLLRRVASAEMGVEERLRAREELLAQLVDALPLGVVHFGLDGSVFNRNDEVVTVLGTDPATVAELVDAIDVEHRDELSSAIASTLEHRESIDQLEVHVGSNRDRSQVCSISIRCLSDAEGAVSGAIATIDDITDRVRVRHQLERRAATDHLTGCMNRRAIIDALHDLTADIDRTRDGAAVIFVDLDHFKEINDRFGHGAGDDVLTTVADAIRGAVREVDSVGRYGGDEFLVICPDVPTTELAERIASRVSAAVTIDSAHERGAIEIRASVGVAHASGPISSAELLDRADAAMYRAKRRGRSRVTMSAAP